MQTKIPLPRRCFAASKCSRFILKTMMNLVILVSALFTSAAFAQQPGGQINSPEALASPGAGKYGAVSATLGQRPQSGATILTNHASIFSMTLLFLKRQSTNLR
jgi:hypothetical protein